MISAHWLEKRKVHWKRLELLLEQAQRQGLGSLTRQELQDLGLLYRQAAADLSAAREDVTGKNYARSLNLLLSRAHNIIYSGQKSSGFGIYRFFRYTYPLVFRRNLGLIGFSFLLFILGGLAGMLLTLYHPDFMHLFIPPQMMETIEARKMWTDSVVSIKPLAASGIMTNNITVSFGAFAMGITAGLGTLYMEVFNGVMVGVIGVACWLNNMSLSLWSFIAPHGILELPAIFIAGGAGFRIAQGLLFPGLLSRRDSLARAGAEATRLVVGIVPILIVAGTLEGFVSPLTTLAPHWKFLLSAMIGTIFFSYLFLAGKHEEQQVSSFQ